MKRKWQKQRTMTLLLNRLNSACMDGL
jgi:hypothetical protein